MFIAVAYVIASPTVFFFLVVVPYRAVFMQPPIEITAKLQLHKYRMKLNFVCVIFGIGATSP